MLRTRLCDLLGIEHPIIQAGMGSNCTSAELVAAVTNAGGLGSLGAGKRPLEDIRRHLDTLPHLTTGPYAVSHMVPILDPAAFDLTLERRPRAVTFALAPGGDLVARARDAGVLVIQQVHTVAQACQAAEQGADIIIAQGGESGGFSGSVATMILVPQVVDAVSPLPVVAAGGITDGRGLAAALMLGAVGVNIGTRFLATAESPIADEYKETIVGAASEEAIKADIYNEIVPVPGRMGFGTVPRAVRTSFLDSWTGRGEPSRPELKQLARIFAAAESAGTFHQMFPFAGQSVGAIHSVRSAADVVREIVREAADTLRKAAALAPQAS